MDETFRIDRNFFGGRCSPWVNHDLVMHSEGNEGFNRPRETAWGRLYERWIALSSGW